jgi:primosomal protein N' (replication factor Y)
MGTQKVEQAVGELFPSAVVARIDSDTMGKKHGFIHILNLFRGGEIDVLVGTQMIGKGLDFPRVTLVGLINADGSLNQQDFRANERTFQLLVQVAGRSGRGEYGGEVVLQTHIPGNETIFLAKNANFEEFVTKELALRQHFAYPPYRHIIHCNLSGIDGTTTELLAKDFAQRLREVFRDNGPEVEIRGPTLSPIEKIQDRYRYSVLVFTANVSKICEKMDTFRQSMAFPPGVSLCIDVDAQDFT